MEKVELRDVRQQLSQIIERLAMRDGYIIMSGGKEVAQILPPRRANKPKFQRLGFMKGKLRVPDDFDQLGAEEISASFMG